jgi:hypothetical protein
MRENMKSRTGFNKLSAILVMLILLVFANVQRIYALEHPFILANAAEKIRLQELIDNYGWAAGRLEDMEQNMATHLQRHKASPSNYLKEVPGFPGIVNAHGKVLNLALEAGVLYFMTENEDYAQLAADILNVYVQQLGVEGLEPIISTDGPVRDYWDLFPLIGLTYDFIHPFLLKEDTMVFDKVSGGRIAFDNEKAQLMLERTVEYGFKYWIEGSNHTIMEGAGILYCALDIEDKQKRDAYIQTFLKGSRPMTGMYWMKQLMLDNHGVWPESAGYSEAGQIVYILMDALDRSYPEFGIFDGCEKMLTGFSDKLFYSYPNNSESVCFGDAHRQKEGRPKVPEFVIHFVRRAGLEEEAKPLLQDMTADREEYGVGASLSHHTRRGGHWMYKEFLSMEKLTGYEPKRIESETVILPYAGIVIQNNLHCTDKKEHGMMYYTGGAEYVHSHCSGLDLEIYGAGSVMSGVGGICIPRRRSDAKFNDYYRDYAGHNTVVVNGTSRGGSVGFWGSQKMLYMDRTQMEALEPEPYTPAVSKEFSFSSQILNDTINQCMQQRIVSMVRTSETSGYYFDLFRSRSEGENKYHDYIYHNIGDSFVLRQDSGAALALHSADDRYPSYPVTRYRVKKAEKNGTTSRYISPDNNGGKYTESLTLRFPGWHYFTDVMTSDTSVKGIKGTFSIDSLNRYVHVAMPSGIEREYTAAKAPPIYEAAGGYAAVAKKGKEEKTHAQVLSIRQYGEAWNRPFIVIYEPSANENPTVQSVENILDNGKVIGAKVVSNVDGKVITDRIISRDRAGETYIDQNTKFSFTGRFAIVRTVKSESGNKLELYIGDGTELSYQGHQLSAVDAKAYKSLDL